MDYTKIHKWAKGIAYGLIGAFFIVFVCLAVSVSIKNKTIKKYKSELKAQTEQIDSLQNRCERYGQMEGISVSTTFVINNKNIMSLTSNAVSNVTRNYAVMTKEEVLHALDSLNKVNND